MTVPGTVYLIWVKSLDMVEGGVWGRRPHEAFELTLSASVLFFALGGSRGHCGGHCPELALPKATDKVGGSLLEHGWLLGQTA
jgi:hypothetical protein